MHYITTLFRALFGQSIVEESMEYTGLLAGLGNPGAQYAGTRHNVGFDFVDIFLREAEHEGSVSSLSGNKFNCELWKVQHPRWGLWLVCKPQTFMNLSGKSVQPLLAWHKIAPAQLVVVHDELDIPAGEVRFKTGGGNAGHNGLKSITQMLGTPDFARLRVGIGRPPCKGDVTNWVLGRPDAAGSRSMEQGFATALQTLLTYFRTDTASAARYALSHKNSPPTI